MTRTITAYFDGRVIIPASQLELAAGQELRISIEVVDEPKPRFADLLRFVVDLPGAPTDLSTRHKRCFQAGDGA